MTGCWCVWEISQDALTCSDKLNLEVHNVVFFFQHQSTNSNCLDLYCTSLVQQLHFETIICSQQSQTGDVQLRVQQN